MDIDFKDLNIDTLLLISLIVIVLLVIMTIFNVISNRKKSIKRNIKKEETPETVETDLFIDEVVEIEAPEEIIEEVKPVEKEVVKNEKFRYHISQNKDENSEFHKQWRIRKEGSQKTIKYFKTQKEAIEYGETLTANNGSSVIIHKRDGKTRKKNYTKKVPF